MENIDNDDDFVWHEAKKTLDKEKMHYRSFFYGDEEYHLYDNVFLYDENESEQHIGKIMKLWEEISSGRKMALIRWFLRPNELPLKLRVPALSENTKELFLAFGKGKGVTNENRLDCFDGKCKVLCTSKDVRNRQPSEDDLRDADFFFYRIYNVDRMKLSNVDGIANKLGCDVVYNKVGWVSSSSKKQLHERDTGTSGMYNTRSGMSQKTAAAPGAAEGGHSELKRRTRSSGGAEVQKKAMDFEHEHMPEVPGSKRPNLAHDKRGEELTDSFGELKTKIQEETRPTYTETSRLWQDGVTKSHPVSPSFETSPESWRKAANIMDGEQSLHKDCTQTLAIDGSLTLQETNLSHQSTSSLDPKVGPASAMGYPENLQESGELQCREIHSAKKTWEVNLQQDLLHGKVLLIQNLNPSFTSSDITNLTRNVFKGCLDAQIIPPYRVSTTTYGEPRGEALVIFETESLADLALQELEDKCLVLTGSKRPLIASKAKASEPGKLARFPGHFPLDNFKPLKQRQNEVMIKGLVTSYYSQPNTLEFEMAMEWRYYQDMARGCWDQLYKVQMDDTGAVLRKNRKSG